MACARLIRTQALAFVALVFFATPLSADQTARELAGDFDGLATVALSGSAATGEAYAAMAILDRIVNEFPDSLEARLLRTRGRLPNRSIDLSALSVLAEEWMSANPALPQLAILESVYNATQQAADEVRPAPALSRPRAEIVDLGRLSVGPPGAGSREPAPASIDVSRVIPTRQLTRQLRRHAVLVLQLLQQPDGRLVARSIGSGSFIAPDIILTNAHVVETMPRDAVWLIVNEFIGVRSAQVVSIARTDTAIQIDAAVLRVNNFTSDTWLPFATSSELDQRVLIAGYPGAAARLDRRYVVLENSITNGGVPGRDVIPTALVNEGRINNFILSGISRTYEPQYAMVTAGGNSGSPVVNFCGEIVGLHYSGGAVNAEIKYNSAVNFRDVQMFLGAVGISHTVSQGACPDEE